MPGTEFIGSELLKQVEGNYDRRIGALAEEINEFNALTVEQRHAAWRAAAERAVRNLATRIRSSAVNVTDAELEKFKINRPPYPGEFDYAISSRETQIENLEKAKAKALAYVSALAADQGVVTLHAADLRRIGYAL